MKHFKIWTVVAALALCVAASAFAAPTLVSQGLTRVTYPNGIVQPDSGTFTIEGSAAASIATNDTLGTFFIGNLAYWNVPSATQAVMNVIRFTVTGFPSSVTCDTLGIMTDYAMLPNGPWQKSLNGATYDVVLLGAGGATLADTTGWQFYKANNYALTTDANLGYTWTGWLTAPATQTSLSNPLGWNYVRVRLAGDHITGSIANSVFGAKVTASYFADLTPLYAPQRR